MSNVNVETLITLPCEVGDKAWLLLETIIDGKFEIVESKCVEYVNRGFCEWWSFWINCPAVGNTLEFQRNDFGKSVFLSREEAEAAQRRCLNG